MIYSFGEISFDLGLLMLRLALGIIFLAHGIKKLKNWNMISPTMKILGVAEPLGALGILTGFLFQWAVLGLGIIMMGALYHHILLWKHPFLMKEGGPGWSYPFLILLTLIGLFFFGDQGIYAL